MTAISESYIELPDDAEPLLVYRSLSRPAIASLLLALVALLGVFVPIFLAVGAPAILCGWRALVMIRRYPAEYSGRVPAMLGIALSSVLLVGGVGWHAFVYATEVPEGYTRVHFRQLQPISSRPDLPVSPEALELNGEKIFIKGYVYPDERMGDLNHFILVPDLGTCCFGGQPPLTHMIEVRLLDPLRVRYSMRRRSLAGVLHVDTQLSPIDQLGGVYFKLDANHVR